MKTLTTILLACTAGALSAQVSCDSVNTLYAYNYQNHGAMFNVVAVAPLTLDHVTANLTWGTATYSLYYRNGQFQGHETVAADWTLLGTAPVTSNNTQTISNLPTVVPIDINLPMVAGDTIALYLTQSPLSKVCVTQTGTPWGTMYATDGNLSVSVARTIYQLFGTPQGVPQIWNGSVNYCINGSTAVGSQASLPPATVTRVGDELVVVLDGTGTADLRLVDLAGRTVLRTTIEQGRTALPLGGLVSGIYLVTLEAQGRSVLTQKLFVE